jgi:hypothetical protein
MNLFLEDIDLPPPLPALLPPPDFSLAPNPGVLPSRSNDSDDEEETDASFDSPEVILSAVRACAAYHLGLRANLLAESECHRLPDDIGASGRSSGLEDKTALAAGVREELERNDALLRDLSSLELQLTQLQASSASTSEDTLPSTLASSHAPSPVEVVPALVPPPPSSDTLPASGTAQVHPHPPPAHTLSSHEQHAPAPTTAPVPASCTATLILRFLDAARESQEICQRIAQLRGARSEREGDDEDFEGDDQCAE